MTVPPSTRSCISGAEDDLFSMYFTFVSDGALGPGGPENDDGAEDGRGLRTTVVTNDGMRDHCAKLLDRLPYIR